MGCVRLAYAFVASLLGAVVFTVVGAFGGAMLSLIISSHEVGMVASIASPLDILWTAPILPVHAHFR